MKVYAVKHQEMYHAATIVKLFSTTEKAHIFAKLLVKGDKYLKYVKIPEREIDCVYVDVMNVE